MFRLALPLFGALALIACDPATPTGGFDTDADTIEPEADCRVIYDGRTICFPVGQVCYDPHGIGDGVPIEIDCYSSGSRACHPNSEVWPECAGGWEIE